jgi:hypothetical protein
VRGVFFCKVSEGQFGENGAVWSFFDEIASAVGFIVAAKRDQSLKDATRKV